MQRHIKNTILCLLLLLLISFGAFAKKERQQYVKIITAYGDIYVRLYNETPKHRDNFIKLVKTKELNGTLFHRVIKDFMIQGGDVTSKNAEAGQFLGSGDLGYKVDAEFNPSLFHKKGALAAARDNNPEKASSSCQFYIVQGKTFTDEELNQIEVFRRKGAKIPADQRAVYKTAGGSPHLDGDYTVFGEVVKGIDVVDKIALSKTDRNNRPLEDVRMDIELMKKRAVKKLLKQT